MIIRFNALRDHDLCRSSHLSDNLVDQRCHVRSVTYNIYGFIDGISLGGAQLVVFSPSPSSAGDLASRRGGSMEQYAMNEREVPGTFACISRENQLVRSER